ncbi:hypothetical protein B224_0339 [Aeromonas media WS]|nr:hypothetical protein [Aeromonas media]AHX59516.1 hypothetical protein B224_0339 [Aeromonas media WS]
MISTLLPIASIALKLGSQLLSGSAKTQPAQQPAQQPAPTIQSLFQRLGVNDANSEQNRPAINHFMSELLQTLGQENNGQSLPEAIDAARSQLANGTQSTRLDALQSELDTLGPQGLPWQQRSEPGSAARRLQADPAQWQGRRGWQTAQSVIPHLILLFSVLDGDRPF